MRMEVVEAEAATSEAVGERPDGEVAPEGYLRSFQVRREEAGERVDRAVARHLSGWRGVSRVRVREWIEAGRVRVNGRRLPRPAARVGEGDEIEVALPCGPPPPQPEPQEVPFGVVYEDEHLLALDKPPGLVVHPSVGHREVTLVHGLRWRWRREGLEGAPHLVQRLDRGTSGLLLVAKRGEVHAALTRALGANGARKQYLAVTYGRPRLERGRIDLRIGLDPRDPKRRIASKTEGQPSTTLYEEIGRSEGERAGLALLACTLVTGRTHQIRGPLEAGGRPLVGEPVSGGAGWREIAEPGLAERCRVFPRQALHAWKLELAHPVTGEALALEAPVPADLGGLMDAAGMG